MRCSGISDEAGRDLGTQIRAHRELGWDWMELRLVDGENVSLLPDDAFETVYREVSEAGLGVSCFAGTIGNWAKSIGGDFGADMDELTRVVPRMRRFGTRYLRIMTWPNEPDSPLEDGAWRDESLRRVRQLVEVAEGEGVVMGIENCRGWAGLSVENAIEFLGAVDSPSLKWLYDTGNVVSHGQDPWTFYTHIREQIAYVHAKDCKRTAAGTKTVYCGEGDARVSEILADLARTGYDGFVSIEPHIAAVVHTGETSDAATMYDTYVSYGRRLGELLGGIGRQ